MPWAKAGSLRRATGRVRAWCGHDVRRAAEDLGTWTREWQEVTREVLGEALLSPRAKSEQEEVRGGAGRREGNWTGAGAEVLGPGEGVAQLPVLGDGGGEMEGLWAARREKASR